MTCFVFFFLGWIQGIVLSLMDFSIVSYLLVPVPYVASIMLLGAISSPVPGTFVDEVDCPLHIVRDSESRMEFAFYLCSLALRWKWVLFA